MPKTWPECAVPKVCSGAPSPSNDSKLATAATDSEKAYRNIQYSCKDTSQVTDIGKHYKLLCKADGSFSTPEWPKCRNATNCTGPIPIPPEASGLANSTTDLTNMKEWDEAAYKCKDSSHVISE